MPKRITLADILNKNPSSTIFDPAPGSPLGSILGAGEQTEARDDPQSYIDDALSALTAGDDTADGSQSSDPQSDMTPSSPPPVATGNGRGSGVDPDLAWIIGKESGGRTIAKNPTSSAFGLGQLLDYNRASYAKRLGISNPNTTDYNQQLAMMKEYVKERYGTPAKARQFWESHGWY